MKRLAAEALWALCFCACLLLPFFTWKWMKNHWEPDRSPPPMAECFMDVRPDEPVEEEPEPTNCAEFGRCCFGSSWCAFNPTPNLKLEEK